jgi:hypothetical protein
MRAVDSLKKRMVISHSATTPHRTSSPLVKAMTKVGGMLQSWLMRIAEVGF